MNLSKDAREIIRTLEENRFYAECPCCGEPILLRDAGLFYLDDFSPEAEELYKQRLDELKEQDKEIRERRKRISGLSPEFSKTAPPRKGIRAARYFEVSIEQAGSPFGKQKAPDKSHQRSHTV